MSTEQCKGPNNTPVNTSSKTRSTDRSIQLSFEGLAVKLAEIS